MGKRIFISYVYEDRAYADQLLDWARRGLLGNYDVFTESEDVRQGGPGAIMGHLRPLLREADGGIVLIGQDTHDRRWVDREVAYLCSNGKPVIPVRIPNTTGAAPPEVRSITPCRFTPDEVKRALDAAFSRR